METATTDELQKITAMKWTITSFTTKLENFINETKATDKNLLMLLSHLTDSIQAFVLAAKVIQTNHTIESVVDKNVLTCENIFECLACNLQTGKTYVSVLNHVNTAKHIAHVKQFEKLKKQQLTAKTSITVAARAPVKLPHFPSNRGEFEMNPSQPMHVINSQLPGPFPQLHNHLNNLYAQPLIPPIQRPMLIRPTVGITHGLPINPMQGNAINNFGISNNTLVNGLMGNFNQLSPFDALHDYKELFRMPLPTNVVGFQQNVVSPSNKYLRNFKLANEESDKNEPAPVKTRKTRKQRRTKAKKSNSQPVEMQVKLLDEETISFLTGNFPDDVIRFINTAATLSNDDLYTDITLNLKERCKEMNLDAEIKGFGSRIIGIGSTKSDVDLNISVTDCSRTTDDFLQQLMDNLSNNASWSGAFYIKSRVSLVRAHHVNMDLDCDITFNNELAMANTKLIKYFYRIQPECHKVVVFVKMLTEKVKLHPQINTYTINLLVFFYFQVKGYLPKVVDLIEASTLKHWPNEFSEKTSDELNLKPTKTFNELCVGFMDFYAHHVDFETNVLSTFTGATIPKSLFGTAEYRELNDCFNGLLQYMEENAGAAECIRTNFKMAMCVQDPFSHDHNVSRCVGKLNLKRFKECCHETYEFLLFQSSENDLS